MHPSITSLFAQASPFPKSWPLLLECNEALKRFTFVTAHDFDPQSSNGFVTSTAVCFTTCSIDCLHGKHLSACKLNSTFLAHRDGQDF